MVVGSHQPTKQYKDVDQNRKAREAENLQAWIEEAVSVGFHVTGMVNVIPQPDAARFGLDLIEELPETYVSEIADGVFRLHFGKWHINLTVALALIYYWTTAHFGALRAASPVGGWGGATAL